MREKRSTPRGHAHSLGDVYLHLFSSALAAEVDPHEQEVRRQMLWELGTRMRTPDRQKSDTPWSVAGYRDFFADAIRITLDEKIDGRARCAG